MEIPSEGVLRDVSPTTRAAALVSEFETKGVAFSLDYGTVRFKAPPATLTSSDVATLQALKREVVAHLRERLDQQSCQPYAHGTQATWVPAPVQRYMVADSGVENSVCSFVWTDRFDLRAIECALDALVLRHGALRTNFSHDSNGALLAVMRVSLQPGISIIDLRSLEARTRDLHAHLVVHALSWRRFDVFSAPLFSFVALRIENRKTIFCIAIHHALCDAMAREILHTDFTHFYDCELRGTAHSLAAPAAEYRDFARIHANWIESEEAVPHIEYWRTVIGQSPLLLSLPHDGPAIYPIHQPIDFSLTLSGERLAGLRRIAADAKVTMFSVFVSILYAALSRWGSGRNLVSWICHFGRPHPALAEVVGCFLNYWYLRVVLEDNLTFIDVVRRVHTAYRDAAPHLGVSFDRVIHELDKINSGKKAPGIVINYVPHLNSRRVTELGSKVLPTAAKLPTQRLARDSPLAIIVHAVESANSLTWALWPNEGLFTDKTMTNLCESLKEVGNAVAIQPRVSIVHLRGSTLTAW